jgi:hypothetical protein
LHHTMKRHRLRQRMHSSATDPSPASRRRPRPANRSVIVQSTTIPVRISSGVSAPKISFDLCTRRDYCCASSFRTLHCICRRTNAVYPNRILPFLLRQQIPTSHLGRGLPMYNHTPLTYS